MGKCGVGENRKWFLGELRMSALSQDASPVMLQAIA